MLFQGGEQLFLYVTVFDGQVMSKTEVWARIRNSSAGPNSTELNNDRPPPGATVFLPNFGPQFPGAGSSGGGNIPPGFIQQSPSVPEISHKPRPPPPPPPPPLSQEQTTLRATSPPEELEPTRGMYHLPLTTSMTKGDRPITFALAIKLMQCFRSRDYRNISDTPTWRWQRSTQHELC